MKRIITFAAILSLGLLGFASCDNKGEEGPVQSSYTLTAADIVPMEGEVVANLDEYAPLTFAWTEGSWDGLGFVTYDLVFARSGESLEAPIMTFHSASLDKEVCLARTLSKDEMKDLFTAAATGPKASEAIVDWGVRTAAGGKRLISERKGSFRITMTPEPDAFAPGNPIYLVCEGSRDDGRALTYMPSIEYAFAKNDVEGAMGRHYNDNNAQDEGLITEYDYEIFAELKADTPVYFWSGETTGGKDWFFILNDDDVLNADGMARKIQKEATFTVKAGSDGVYRIRLNTQNGKVNIKKITNILFRYWKGPVDTNVTYADHYKGNGVWVFTKNVPAGTLGFKFVFQFNVRDQPMGALYPDAKLGATIADTPADYWKVGSVQGGAAQGGKQNGTWLYPAEAEGVDAVYTLALNGDAGYYKLTIAPVGE